MNKIWRTPLAFSFLLSLNITSHATSLSEFIVRKSERPEVSITIHDGQGKITNCGHIKRYVAPCTINPVLPSTPGIITFQNNGQTFATLTAITGTATHSFLSGTSSCLVGTTVPSNGGLCVQGYYGISVGDDQFDYTFTGPTGLSTHILLTVHVT